MRALVCYSAPAQPSATKGECIRPCSFLSCSKNFPLNPADSTCEDGDQRRGKETSPFRVAPLQLCALIVAIIRLPLGSQYCCKEHPRNAEIKTLTLFSGVRSTYPQRHVTMLSHAVGLSPHTGSGHFLSKDS